MTRIHASKTGIRKAIRSFAVAAAMAAASIIPAMAESGYTPSTPEPGTEIPQSSIKMGLKPFADNSFYVISMKKGWFEDAGIKIDPPGGISLTEDNVNAQLLNGNIDLSGQFPPGSVSTYSTSKAIKQTMFTDVIVSASILANPKLGLKTFKDYIAEGMDFEHAIAAALAPVKDKKIAVPSALNERLFEDAVSRFSGVPFNLNLMEDPQILVAASAGQIDFAHPSGAPIVYSLLQKGWVQLVSMDDLLKHAPADPDSPLIPAIQIVGNVGNVDFINNNKTTVLRFMSVVWRTIDELKKDPSLFDLQAPYLNSVAGTSLTGQDIAATVANFQPYVTFDDYGKFYDETNPLYYKPIFAGIIREYVKNGILPEGAMTPEEFIWGEPLYREMVAYKTKADELLAGLEGKELSSEEAGLVTEAKKYYDWRNYLDAYRLALAASAN